MVCLWLAVVGLVALVLQGTGMLRSAAAIEVLMPGLLRRILAAALGASLGTGAITIAAANASALRSPPPVLRAISDTPSPAKAPSSSQPPKLFAAKEKAQQEAGQEAAAPSTPRRGSTWTVREGDNFWAIAAQVLAKADGGTQPSDARIEAYWWRLVKANEARLVDPGVPDLIFAGQVMSLPPLQA